MAKFSLLRYPGGKQWFAEILRRNVEASGNRVLIEPFAGGASAGISLLLSKTIDTLILVELDARVSAFWNAVLDDPGFADRVAQFDVPLPNVIAPGGMKLGEL